MPKVGFSWKKKLKGRALSADTLAEERSRP